MEYNRGVKSKCSQLILANVKKQETGENTTPSTTGTECPHIEG